VGQHKRTPPCGVLARGAFRVQTRLHYTLLGADNGAYPQREEFCPPHWGGRDPRMGALLMGRPEAG